MKEPKNVRGGSWLDIPLRDAYWLDSPDYLRAANRNCYSPEYRSHLGGFRLIIKGISRVVRGGSWLNGRDVLCAAFRNCFYPGYRNHNGGFRIVKNKCKRVIRGGSLFDVPVGLRTADRNGGDPDYRYQGGGFRLIIKGISRVVRGGSWLNVPDVLCAAFRDGVNPGNGGHNGGFRIVKKKCLHVGAGIRKINSFTPYIGKEDDFQIAVTSFIRKKYPELLHVHVANERKTFAYKNKFGRNYSPAGNKLKRKGVVPGVPDNLIFDWKLAIELKVGRNKLTKNQRHILNRLCNLNWQCFVCYSLNEVIYIIDECAKGRFSNLQSDKNFKLIGINNEI
jgi:hypothetical protein